MDIRIIAATNTDLKKAIAKGAFREDLYYRLNVIPIRVPSLKDRKTDIPLFLDFFLEKFNKRKNKHIKGFTPEAVTALLQYDWPGNVRQLENLVERLVILTDHEEICFEDLSGNFHNTDEPVHTVEMTVTDKGIPFNAAVEEYEKQLILQALNKTNWVKKRAAELLNINRTTLVEKIKKKNIVRPHLS